MNKKITLSKSDWKNIGVKAGWINSQANTNPNTNNQNITNIISKLKNNPDPRIQKIVELYQNNNIQEALREYLQLCKQIKQVAFNSKNNIKMSGLTKNIMPLLSALMMAGPLFANNPTLDNNSKMQVNNVVQELNKQVQQVQQVQGQSVNSKIVNCDGQLLPFNEIDLPTDSFTYAPVKDKKGNNIVEDAVKTVHPFVNINGVRHEPIIQLNGKKEIITKPYYDEHGKMTFLIGDDYCLSEQSAKKVAEWLNFKK